mmetsp:Transcript_26651/g.43577  ORF Transcript_26651/g.43577 Transcript_26651/m.43577 type:complete len:219 (-) Transcript_26651:542-1198(-)|eukprot:CAMPEP_0184657140 /NCGR_PEP_ID=MMETSP0308-20130426/17007_1 /TAXON_ID=38269 /ORGANISM="Gloeochaete witrockiana, Strain SAG 46.84" /LENGTH=218 /DNA_ID=CAMNT_0027094569 /DNA_START=93 /DNA_END=749 /DNA_ORIENTATION=-
MATKPPFEPNARVLARWSEDGAVYMADVRRVKRNGAKWEYFIRYVGSQDDDEWRTESQIYENSRENRISLDVQYEVERIVDEKYQVATNEYYFRVRWKGWTETEDQWVPESHFTSAGPIEEWRRQRSRQASNNHMNPGPHSHARPPASVKTDPHSHARPSAPVRPDPHSHARPHAPVEKRHSHERSQEYSESEESSLSSSDDDYSNAHQSSKRKKVAR